MVHRRTLTLSDDERRQLIQYRDHHPRPQVRERCAALVKIAEGQSPHQVARQGLLKARDADTIYQWLNLYEREGLNGLITRLHGGPRRRGP